MVADFEDIGLKIRSAIGKPDTCSISGGWGESGVMAGG